MAFSTFVAYWIFGITSLIFVAIVTNAFIPKSDIEELRERLEAYKNGHSTKIDWRKVAFLFMMWLVSGIYLFG